ASLSQVGGEVTIGFLEKHRDHFFSKKNPYIVTGVEGQDLLIRRLTTPLKKQRAIRETLPFQLEALIPYQLDEVVVKPIYTPKGENTEALFFTVSKKNLEKHLMSLEEEGLSPQWVSAVPMALSRFASLVCPEEPNLVVFHIGSTKIQIVSLQDGTISSHLTLHIGTDDLKEGKDKVAKLKREVDRAFCFLSHKEEMEGKRSALFCGKVTKEIEALLMHQEGLVPIEGDGRGEFTWETMRSFAIPIGLALDALKNDAMSIQFRQGMYVSKRCIQTLRKKVFLGVGLAAVLLALTTASSRLFFFKKEKNLLNQISHLIEKYQEDFPQLAQIDLGEKLPVLMSNLSKTLKVKKGKDNVFISPPLVSDVLTFLATHPQLEGVEVIKVDYELKKYPTLEKPQEEYLPKVHLVFNVREAKKARAFHDAIVEDTTFVDGSKEIGWKRNDDQYEITFFLLQ
ncbi:MAG: hypothetical protein KDK64_04870, partial [Chlamydiia bacterium]|nr:hypothetical protein [Chlamydiia bacterium]